MTREELEDLCEGFKMQSDLYFREWQAAKAQNEKLQLEVEVARQAVIDYVRPSPDADFARTYENTRRHLPSRLRKVAPTEYRTPKERNK